MTSPMSSLRLRLFLLIASATALVWSLAAAWSVLGAQADIERVLDARLREAAMMVGSLGQFADRPTVATSGNATLSLPSYERQLSCQIWSIGGDLLGFSQGAPNQALSNGQPGFSEPVVDGIAWRVYTYVTPETGVTIMVGDTQKMRRGLIAGLVKGLIIPALTGLLALGALLWFGVQSGLAPVRRIAQAISGRAPDDPGPFTVDRVPRELSPLTQAVDDLFTRIAVLRAGEKRFLAGAAHEMLTPLAGLRTHADIALRARDDGARERALARIKQSVDRTARLVRQLLEWSRHDLDRSASDETAALGEAVDAVALELEHLFAQRGVTLHVSEEARAIALPLSRDALIIALRNLIENAALHGPENSRITVGSTGDGFYVQDCGQGIPPRDVEAMLEPFARGSIPNIPGSGLGLAITVAALLPRMALTFEMVDLEFRARAYPVTHSADDTRSPRTI